jgi:hypothetical protein
MLETVMDQYLRATEIVDWQTPAILELARDLASGKPNLALVTKSCFEFVRDEITHSGDHKSDVTTCRASDVLHQRTGWCLAKSHLLAALLRANGILAGLCYQRLQLDDGERFTLHGLNAVHLPKFGWYRIDARGNKQDVNAQFCPPEEALAWLPRTDGEHDFPEIWPDPLPIIIDCLRKNHGWEQVTTNLPDIAVCA